MIREEVFKPLVGPIGALGISNETRVDLGKERRTATKAPPGEMLMEVANSKESLPLPSRIRTKTGMASCSRAHLRSSFLDKLRRTCPTHPFRGINAPKTASQGPNLGEEPSLPGIGPNLACDTEITDVAPERKRFHNDLWSYRKSARFFRFSACFGLFPIDSLGT
jgi:hypothetical protein